VSFVYFIRAGETGPIKIGYTAKSPKRRMGDLQTGSPQPLSLLLVVKGDVAYERKMHLKFQAARSHGEWFRPTRSLIRYIEYRKARQEAGKRSRRSHDAAVNREWEDAWNRLVPQDFKDLCPGTTFAHRVLHTMEWRKDVVRQMHAEKRTLVEIAKAIGMTPDGAFGYFITEGLRPRYGRDELPITPSP
jgi:hypothetical protein